MDTLNDKYMKAVHLLNVTHRRHRMMCEDKVDTLGMNRSQHRMLMYLSRNEATPSQKELVEKFGVTAAAITGSLAKLQADGYITREMSTVDQRRNIIRLTEKGKKVAKQSCDFFRETDKSLLKNLDEKSVDQLIKLLEKLLGDSYSE